MSSTPYIHGHHASVLRSHSWRTVENSCPHLITHLNNPSLKILDVGCGPGTISIDLASRVPQGFVLAIDPSAEVIKKAQKMAHEKGVTNVRFEVGSIFHWDLIDGIEEESFDIVHAHQVLQHLQDPLTAMRVMKKLTRIGGVVAVRDCDYSAMSHYPPHAGMGKWLDLYRATAKSIHCDPDIGKRLHAIARQAGFSRCDIHASVSAWTFSTPDERAWWCGVWAERSLKSDYKTLVLENNLGTEQDLHEIAQTWKDMELEEDGWFAVINGEVIARRTC
jgi:ubiquinone/menaquinone biosynthesis C-methylase UbiE